MNKLLQKTIDDLLLMNKTLVIAIEGPCTAGKSTLSEVIKETYNCNVIHMDDFFLPFELRGHKRMCEIGGNIDYERFKTEVVEKLHSDSPFLYGKFSCSEGKVTEHIEITPKKLTIIEGVYSMHPHFGDIYDYKIFLDISIDIKLERLKKRSPEKLEKFIYEWIPKEDLYFTGFNIKEKCDLVINNN